MACRALAAVLALAACAQTGLAQGAYPIAPDPVGLAQLHLQIAARSTEPLSNDDALKIERAHDAYLESMRAVRAGVIEAALQREARAEGNGFTWSDPAAMRDLVRRGEEINAALTVRDNALFDAVAAILGERAPTIVPSLRDCRTTERASAFAQAFIDYRKPISPAFRNAALLTADDRARLEPSLRAFESLEAKLTKAACEANAHRNVRFAELARAAGLDLTVAGNNEQRTALWDHAAADVPDADASREALLNARDEFIAAALAKIPFDARRQVRSRLSDESLSMEPPDIYATEAVLRMALRSKALNDDQRKRVRAIYEKWATKDDALMDELRVKLREPKTWPDRRAITDDGRAAREELGGATRAEITAAVPKEILDRVFRGYWRNDPFDQRALEDVNLDDELPLVRRAASAVRDGHENIDQYRMRWTLPAASVDSVSAWFDDVTPQDQSTIATVMADVKETWERDIVPLIQRGSSKDTIAWHMESTDAEIEQVLKDKYAAHEAAEKLDRTIFDALKAALPAAQLTSVMLAELERLLAIWADGESLMGLNTAWEVELLPNLARVVRSAVAREERAALASILTEEADHLIAVAQRRRRDEFRLTARCAIANMRSMSLQGDQTPEGIARYQELVKEGTTASNALVALRRKTADEFRRVLGRLLEALPDSERPIFRLAYERESHPDLFFDRRGHQQFYDRAMGLLTMNADRVARLEHLRDDFDAKRAEVVFHYVDAIRAKPAYDQPDSNAMANRRRMGEFFERNEVYERAILALRAELSTEERALIHGLDDYERLVARLSSRYWDE